MAGNLSLETCGKLFADSSREASSNYGIDSNGKIALYVDEKDRSWASSNRDNDNRAVTIEVANDGGADTGWHVTDKALASLINLVADICKRNNIKELKWQADKSLIGQVSKQNMTVHRWFANKACPGDYLYNKHSYIAKQVNKKLGVTTSTSSSSSKTTTTTTSTTTKPTVATPTVKKGSTGTQAKYLQQDLKYLGFKGKDGKVLSIDGDFGTNSVYALQAFQKKYGLTVDGIYGSASQKKMKTLIK
jgi:hypothetical protein